MPLLATATKADASAAAAPAAAAGADAAAPAPADASNGGSGSNGADGSVASKHHALLMNLIAGELGCKPSDIVDFELNVCDVQPGQLGGGAEEFVFVGRLDNLASCYTAMEVGGWGVQSPVQRPGGWRLWGWVIVSSLCAHCVIINVITFGHVQG